MSDLAFVSNSASPGSPDPSVGRTRSGSESGLAEAQAPGDLPHADTSYLIGGLVHEIRNPLSTMGLNLDLLAEELRDPESTRDRRMLQKVERVRRETKRLEETLEDFLRFIRVRDLALVRVDLNSVVEDLRDFCEPQCFAQKVVIRVQYDDALPNVLIDVDLFKQALLNLLLNAQNAMPDGGDLILRTRVDVGGWATLDVIDTGCGMDEETLAKAFVPFFSTRKGGSGLGLPTTRRIIVAHGGTIDVRSEPGRGSQFTVRLPAGPDASADRSVAGA